MQNYEEGEIPLISENEAAKGAETPVNQPKTFSHAYFKEAAKVFKDARKLAFAAVICALRVAVKSLSLQIAPGVYLSFDCYVNALGSLVYGPLMALCVGAVSDTIGGVMCAKLMNLFCKQKINPMIGAAGISAFPMAARVVEKMGIKEDSTNHLLMHAVGANVSGQIASAIVGGLIISFVTPFL